MEIIDWDQLALSAAERDLTGIVREIAARYARDGRAVSHRAQATETGAAGNAPSMTPDWRTLVAIADEAEADLGLHARHEPWVLARLLRLPGDEALRRGGELPSLDAAVDLQWPDMAAPAVFRAIVAAFAHDDLPADDAASPLPGGTMLPCASVTAAAVCAVAIGTGVPTRMA
ncbi:hypothetical protein AB870_05290 [Pandoraea faecigallinarum]|uniref:Uncharacterized protein n=1 Tax=Pandoraea faecigallinarum TaxID=656179 RepID=A0A0H3WPB0_9BURK|nr:DUF2471 family protein [Pandoraea faecigallinarum]AKM29662.1 hypothetical protein AB870_05290 [Pandoraea faecigallinarum]